jgi:hypothetical protein
MEVFAQNITNLRKVLFTLIEEIPKGESFAADKVLETARF